MRQDGTHPLDNPIWHALGGPQARFRANDGAVRRYDPEVAPFAATEHGQPSADVAAILPAKGATVFITGRPIEMPEGLEIIMTGAGLQMVAEKLKPDDRGSSLRRLETADVPAMIELVGITLPGPFAARTIELGDYFGVFEGPQLVAMAGERMRVPGYTEISAVCTHPAHRGKGHAKTLITALGQRIAARGETPNLHVRADNSGAIATYEALGFVGRREIYFSLISHVGAGLKPTF